MSSTDPGFLPQHPPQAHLHVHPRPTPISSQISSCLDSQLSSGQCFALAPSPRSPRVPFPGVILSAAKPPCPWGSFTCLRHPSAFLEENTLPTLCLLRHSLFFSWSFFILSSLSPIVSLLFHSKCRPLPSLPGHFFETPAFPHPPLSLPAFCLQPVQCLIWTLPRDPTPPCHPSRPTSGFHSPQAGVSSLHRQPDAPRTQLHAQSLSGVS